MKQGFNIVIGGAHFRPLEVDLGKTNVPDVFVRQDTSGDEPQNRFSVEWNFWEPIEDGADYLTEALSFLVVYYEQIKAISEAPGVDHRSLNLVVYCQEAELFVLNTPDISLLEDLNLELTIMVHTPAFKSTPAPKEGN